MEPLPFPPPRTRRPLLDRIDGQRAGALVIVVGAVLVVITFVSGISSALTDGFAFSGDPNGEVSFWDRVRTFVNFSGSQIAMCMLVVAAGFALRIMARPAPRVVIADPVEMPESPLAMPAPAPRPTLDQVALTETDHEVWKR